MSIKKLIPLALAALIAAPLLQAGPTFSLKLYGGGGYWPSGGDFKTVFDSTLDRWKKVGYKGTLNQDWQPLAYEGGLQAVLMVDKHLGLALGVGYLSKSISHDSNTDYSATGTLDYTDTYNIRSIPVSLDLLYALPVGPVRFVLSAGATLYSSTIDFEGHGLYSEPNRIGQPNWKWDLLQTFESDNKVALGGQAGLGIEIRLSGSASLFLDGFYRMASFDDVRGTSVWDSRQTWTGGSQKELDTYPGSKMWFETSQIGSNTWHYLDFWPTKPTTSDEARLFKVDFGGPVVRIGIKIGV